MTMDEARRIGLQWRGKLDDPAAMDCFVASFLDMAQSHNFAVIALEEALTITPREAWTLWKAHPLVQAKRYACPCCGYQTLPEPSGSFDICPICFWEADPVQSADPDYGGGANIVSLRHALRNFADFG